MVYENNSQTKQEIFRQIDQDILSQRKSNMTIHQKTKSNYRFVIVLDCVALLFAMVGIIFVYNIFKEQQIKLVSGQQGVRVLESTLLEEINRQYAHNIAEMEQMLRESNDRLMALELSHAEELARISAESILELERQRAIIQREMLLAMQGKTIPEQAEIRQQYETQLKEIEDIIARDNATKEEAQQEKYKRTLLQITQEANKSEQEIETLKNRIDKTQITNTNSNRVNAQVQVVDDGAKNFEESATSLFLQTKQLIDAKDYDSATVRLSDISTLYQNPPPTLSPQRKTVDSYFVSVLQELMNTSEKSKLQETTISNLEKALSNSGQTFGRSVEMTLQMLNRGDDFVKNGQYDKAVESYQSALQYSTDDKSEEIIQKLYNAILMDVHGANIPKNLESSVRKLLKDTRYNDMEYPIVYLKEPNGYIADIIDKDNVLVLLLPRERINRHQALEIYRVTSQNGIQLEKIGEFRSKSAERDTFKMQINNHRIKLGDLIYIK